LVGSALAEGHLLIFLEIGRGRKEVPDKKEKSNFQKLTNKNMLLLNVMANKSGRVGRACTGAGTAPKKFVGAVNR